MNNLYREVSFRCSKMVTNKYSTSFSFGVKMLHRSLQDPIYSIYGFVRLADEIVDTFHEFDKNTLLHRFEEDYYHALNDGISLNLVLNAFQHTVKKYAIDDELVKAFLHSMKSDISKKEFNDEEIKQYIYGSADVVGLMCLKVFTGGNQVNYEKLRPYAMKLGSAFQKVNFLRDLNQDRNCLKRIYFPVLLEKPLNPETKKQIIDDIESDFLDALQGIKMLPATSKTGVYTAYLYYLALTRKLRKTSATDIISARIRISDAKKLILLAKAWFSVRCCII